MAQRRTLGIPLAMAMLLLLYLGGYAVSRAAHVLVHTDCVLNVNAYGRAHSVHRSSDSLVGRAVETVFWPLREIEALLHGRT